MSDTTSSFIGNPRDISAEEKDAIVANAMQFTGKSVAQAALESAARLKDYLINNGHFSGLVLRYEAALGSLPSVEKLIGTAPHAINEPGRATHRTALHQAAIHGHAAVCQCLITNGASLSLTDKDGNTALHHAVQLGHYDLAEKLVALGADICIKNKAGQNAIATLVTPGTQAVRLRLIELQRDYEENCNNVAEPASSCPTV